MRFRERPNEPSNQHQQPAPGDPTQENLNNLREAGEQLFRAADDAINRALSGDSLAFLEATRQEGGQ